MTSLRKRLTRRKDRRRLYEGRHLRRDVSGNTSDPVSETDGINSVEANAAARKTHTTVEDTATLISKLQKHLNKIKNEHRRVKYHIYHGHVDNYNTDKADISSFLEPEGTPTYSEEPPDSGELPKPPPICEASFNEELAL